MRTYPILGFSICSLIALAFAHCGPIAPSTEKSDAPSAAVSGKDLTAYNPATVESMPTDSGAIAASSQWVATALDSSDLQSFKDSGEIPIPSSWGSVDPNKVQVKILVNSSSDDIAAKQMSPLRFTAGKGPNGPYLKVANKDASKASEVQAAAVGVQIAPPGSQN